MYSNLNYPDHNTRWLPDDVFKKLKLAWLHGLSDHQSPTSRAGHGALNYILKYVSKSSSSTHLWKLILSNGEIFSPSTNENGYPIRATRYAGYKKITVAHSLLIDRCTFQTKKIKLVTWSRNFIKSYLSTLQTSKPCPNAASLHNQ